MRSNCAPIYNMTKDKRVIQAEEILDILEENSENSKHSSFISSVIGGFVIILIGSTILKEIKNQL